MSEEASRDLVQDVFLAAWRAMPDFRGESNIDTWLGGIAHNVWRNYIRSRAAERRHGKEDGGGLASDLAEALEESIPATYPPSPLESLLDREQHERLEAALAELPPQVRVAASLRFTDGFKYHEIADRMQVSINTVKAYLYEAKQRLHRTLALESGDET